MDDWSKEQFAEAMKQIDRIPAFAGFLDWSGPEVVDALLDIFCQRNELLRQLEVPDEA